MFQPTSEDPFLWDIDRVCKELCSKDAEWANDTSVLESLLRENLIDGETLLTYELTFSRKELVECLGITAARHRAKFIRKILNLQARSPSFRQAKTEIENEELQNISLSVEPSNAHATSPLHSTPTISPYIAKQQPAAVQEPAKSDDPPLKRRRLIPTFVADLQQGVTVPRMPGFEEPESRNLPKTQIPRAASSEDLSTAYLGNKAVTEECVIPQVHSDSDSDSDGFSSIKVTSQPRGKTKAIYSLLKKHLLKNNRKVARIQSGVKTVASSDEGREVVDLDDLASLDEDTLREIADEEEENKQANSSLLSSETVEEIINDEISKIQTRWEEKKLPKHQKKAYRSWTHARKHGLLRSQTLEAQQQARHYRNRLSRLTGDLRVLPWKVHEELRFQTHIVEQTVFDKLHQEWLAKLFSLRSAPPKPPPSQQQKLSHPPKKFIHNDELSSSSEEEPLENFIEEDDLDSARANSTSPRGALSPRQLPPANSIQNQPHSPASSLSIPAASQADSFIDLTVASDVEMEGTEEKLVPRTFDPFTQDSLAEIGSTPPKVWAQQKDRFRLVISILWKLNFERREAVLKSLAGSTVSKIWSDLVGEADGRFKADDPPVIDSFFDLTLIYLSFLKCRYYKEQKLEKMSQKDIDKLEDSSESFPPFCGFIASIKDLFPQKNQIARLDDYDDDDELVELDGLPGDAAAGAKKTKKKEIILDKSGVELRERAVREMREQERRRNELRAAMRDNNTYDASSAESPRFIINESKREDQGFIYVHREISLRIKDHQIEGVRFLWNHIVREQSERQGCLLAHTMGLGKTMQTITFLVALRQSALSDDPTIRDQIPQDLRDWKVLVLCPSGLVENWKDEFLIWAPQHLMKNIITIEAYQSSPQRIDNAKYWASEGGVLITGYNMFKSGFRKGLDDDQTIDRILVENATVVIADEAHTLKNPRAKVTQVASELKTSTRIALTGSPLANNVEEYYAMINWVAPNFLGPLQEFRDMYAAPIHQGLYHDSTTAEKRRAIKLLQVLKTTAAPKVHRATIKSCLKDELPPKEEFVISVPPTQMQRQLYDLYMQAAHYSGDKLDQASLFGVLNHLALICAHPAAYRRTVIDLRTKAGFGKAVAKFPMETIPQIMKITNDMDLNRTEFSNKVELLNKILNQSSRLGDKVLVFSQSIPTLNYLDKLFQHQGRRFCRLDGSTLVAKRQDMVKRFNTGSDEVYLISTNAGGVGLNIYGANRVVIFDFKWNPVQDQQAIGRAYRIGQTKPVFVYRFVVAGSFEDDLQNKAVFKMQLASRVVDQKNVVSWSKRLANLLHPIKDVDATEARFAFKGKDIVLDHILDHDNSRAILSIMSSDTFEEEDQTAALTEEERQEAASMVERHHLRMMDPEKYNQVMQAERVASNQRPVSHIASGKPNKDWFPGRPDHTSETPTLYSHIAPQDSVPTAPVPTPSSGPMPILGANTYYGNSGGSGAVPTYPPALGNNGLANHGNGGGTAAVPTYSPVLGSNGFGSPAYHGNSGGFPVVPTYSNRSNGSSAFSEGSRREAQLKFQRQLTMSLHSAQVQFPNCRFDAEKKALSITTEIELERTKLNKGLPADELRWNMLTGKLASKKVLLAISSDHLPGKYLGTASDEAMQSRFQKLEELSTDYLLEIIQAGGRPKDPEVRQAEQEHMHDQREEEESKD
ncbi:SNF2 family helicase [Cordyceps militaris]|uniref:SNF2 family helicase n=1 Tax=Cordyceps militaris TaxID=73501 RepID=A0A2H4SQA0_CORMI|nr:SNF2 family helicase [Cordyceps militaris]